MRAILFFAFVLAGPAFASPGAPAPSQASMASPGASPTEALADSPRFELGLSVGYAYGLGRETRDAPMPDLTFGTLPLTLDLNYALSGRLALGVYGGYGLMFPNGCPEGVSCSGRALHLGLRARYRFSEGGGIIPWASLGAGYERLSETDTYQGIMVDSAASGVELLRLEFGLSHPVSRGFAFGPYLSASFGEFLSRELAGTSTDISPRTPHFWVMAGLRSSFWL